MILNIFLFFDDLELADSYKKFAVAWQLVVSLTALFSTKEFSAMLSYICGHTVVCGSSCSIVSTVPDVYMFLGQMH